MTFNNDLKKRIEELTGEVIVSSAPAAGESLNKVQIVKCKSNLSFFLKINESHSGIFLKEANGLGELKKANVIRVPEVIIVEPDFILLENILPGAKSKNFFSDFGAKFAQLHKFTSDTFGFYENNFIGLSLQVNTPPETDWKTFYWKNRILFQVKLCQHNGYLTEELKRLISDLENKLDYILTDSENISSLLHGDLWSGNYLSDENGNVCIIDPAVYYGNHEADLAMTKLFGGFSPEFYTSYNEVFPLPVGYNYRENFYKLYHVLNHLNLFGSGYYSHAVSLIKYYLD